MEAAVEIDCLPALGVEELRDSGGASTDRANADDPVVDFIQAMHQLIQRNVHRTRDATLCPLVVSSYVQEHPALGHPPGHLAGLHARDLISKHQTTLIVESPSHRKESAQVIEIESAQLRASANSARRRAEEERAEAFFPLRATT
jgi:hypothetical protein